MGRGSQSTVRYPNAVTKQVTVLVCTRPPHDRLPATPKPLLTYTAIILKLGTNVSLHTPSYSTFTVTLSLDAKKYTADKLEMNA